ncbi:hypothetical protein GGTG_13888 [Gaeumannomyces tritici R3-111a-1]|uniref:Uncharacterized protein n=1 Tax=Gaeumannomyces tritici (strain R3-111a-1) TaxID=644352 RepID=J3PK43_GAET3|nr:hypothetical protein GGTG_13888 [Gaeumannomyces tritici R3-111a-1]EJT68544.1 hypothetical protein GGTG_13888 [Gaeumannomyces tritici R3-111a-1]
MKLASSPPGRRGRDSASRTAKREATSRSSDLPPSSSVEAAAAAAAWRATASSSSVRPRSTLGQGGPSASKAALLRPTVSPRREATRGTVSGCSLRLEMMTSGSMSLSEAGAVAVAVAGAGAAAAAAAAAPLLRSLPQARLKPPTPLTPGPERMRSTNSWVRSAGSAPNQAETMAPRERTPWMAWAPPSSGSSSR